MTDLTEYPDAKKHQIISFIKSGVRIAACIAGIWSLPALAIGLGIAELIGIYEELV